jgi:arsenate reductase
MAEAIWRQLGAGRWEAVSAGTDPRGVHPLTLRVLEEAGFSTKGLRSKSLEEFAAEQFDLVVTVCDRAQESCPAIVAAPQRLHWSLPDPAAAVGPEQEQLNVFRRVRDEIRRRIEEHLKSSD